MFLLTAAGVGWEKEEGLWGGGLLDGLDGRSRENFVGYSLGGG